MESLIILLFFLIPAFLPMGIGFLITWWSSRNKRYIPALLAGVITTTILLVAELLLLMPGQLRCDLGLGGCGGDVHIRLWGLEYVALVVLVTLIGLATFIGLQAMTHRRQQKQAVYK